MYLLWLKLILTHLVLTCWQLTSFEWLTWHRGYLWSVGKKCDKFSKWLCKLGLDIRIESTSCCFDFHIVVIISLYSCSFLFLVLMLLNIFFEEGCTEVATLEQQTFFLWFWLVVVLVPRWWWMWWEIAQSSVLSDWTLTLALKCNHPLSLVNVWSNSGDGPSNCIFFEQKGFWC